MARMDGAEIVMMDPDNGLGDDRRMYQQDGPKYLYLRDLEAVWEAGKSLVMYQHIHRIGDAVDQIHDHARTIRTALAGADPIAFLFRRGTARAFFVIPQPDADDLRLRAARFAGTLWADSGHFQWVP